MGRILAIDYGQKRVGLAVTDPLGMIANNIGTVNSVDIWSFLATYIAKEKVDTIVVGLPTTLSNQPSESIVFINPFLKKLEQTYPDITIKTIDERFTSKIAMQTMISGGMSKKDRRDKSNIDAISATIILQSYMEQQANNRF